MKLDFSMDQLKRSIIEKKQMIFILLGLIALGVVSYAVYSVVVVNDDPAVVAENDQESQQLNITFDKKFLLDLENKQSAGSLNQASGRNPFIPY